MKEIKIGEAEMINDGTEIAILSIKFQRLNLTTLLKKNMLMLLM